MAIPEPDSPSIRERQPERPDPKTSPPVITFTADDYASRTADDRAKYRFLKEHHQQLVEVGGRVQEVTPRGNGTAAVRLLTRTGKATGLDLNVTEPVPLPKVLPGQTASFRGVVTGGLLVTKWRLQQVTGDPPPVVTATDFLKEYEAAEEATKAKREGKFFVLTGEIAQVELPTPDAKACTLRLKAGSGTVAAVFLNGEAAERERNAGFQVGATVRLVGECELGTPRLVRCSIVAE